MDHAIFLLIPAHDLASVVDAPREGGSGARKVNQGSNALSEQIAMPDACRGIDVETDNFFPLVDSIIHGEGHRVPSDLTVMPDNPVHRFHGVGIVLATNNVALCIDVLEIRVDMSWGF